LILGKAFINLLNPNSRYLTIEAISIRSLNSAVSLECQDLSIV
jgi:hypothetical protein